MAEQNNGVQAIVQVDRDDREKAYFLWLGVLSHYKPYGTHGSKWDGDLFYFLSNVLYARWYEDPEKRRFAPLPSEWLPIIYKYNKSFTIYPSRKNLNRMVTALEAGDNDYIANLGENQLGPPRLYDDTASARVFGECVNDVVHISTHWFNRCVKRARHEADVLADVLTNTIDVRHGEGEEAVVQHIRVPNGFNAIARAVTEARDETGTRSVRSGRSVPRVVMNEYGEPYEEQGLPVRARKTMAYMEYFDHFRQRREEMVDEYQEHQQTLGRMLEPEEELAIWQAGDNAAIEEVRGEESVYENPSVVPVETETPVHPPRAPPPAENSGQPAPRTRPPTIQKPRMPEAPPAPTLSESTQPKAVSQTQPNEPCDEQNDLKWYVFYQQFLDMDQNHVKFDDFKRYIDMVQTGTPHARVSTENARPAIPQRSTVDNKSPEQPSSSNRDEQQNTEQKCSTSGEKGVNPAPTSSKTSPTTTSTDVREGKKCGEKCSTPRDAISQPRRPKTPNLLTDTPGLVPDQQVEWQPSTEWNDWKGNGKWTGGDGRAWQHQQPQAGEVVQPWRRESVKNGLGAWIFSKEDQTDLSTFTLVDRSVSEAGDGYTYTPYFLQKGKNVVDFESRGEYLMYMAFFYAYMVKQVKIPYSELPTVKPGDDMIGQYRMVIEAWQAIQGYRFKIRYDYVSENQVMDFTLEEVMWRAQLPTTEEQLRVLSAVRTLIRYINSFQKRRLIGVGTCFDFLRENTRYGKQLGVVPLYSPMQGAIDITTSNMFPHVRVCVTNIHLWDNQQGRFFSFKNENTQFPTRLVTKEWLHYQRIFTRRCNTLGNGDSYDNIPILSYWTDGYPVQEREKPVLDQMMDRITQAWVEANQSHREQRPMVRGPNGGIY